MLDEKHEEKIKSRRVFFVLESIESAISTTSNLATLTEVTIEKATCYYVSLRRDGPTSAHRLAPTADMLGESPPSDSRNPPRAGCSVRAAR